MSSLRDSLKQLKDALKQTGGDGVDGEDDGRVFSVHTRHTAETLESTRKLIEADPRNRELLDWYAYMLYSNECYSEAADVYMRLLEQEQGSVEHLYYLGCCLYRVGRTEDAVARWQEAVKLAPTSLYGAKCREKVEQVYERDYEARLLADPSS